MRTFQFFQLLIMDREEYERLLFKELLPGLFQTSNVISNIQVDSFNFFLEHRLQKIIEEDHVIDVETDKNQSVRVRFGQVYVDFPYIIDNKRDVKYISPHESRVRELTYSSCVSVDIQLESFVNRQLTDTTRHSKVLLARIPMMIGSKKCNLKRQEDRDVEECKYDPGGYFIIKGKERVLISQERGNLNQIYVFRQRNANKYNFFAELRAMSEENGHSVLVHMKLSPELYKVVLSTPFFQQDIDLVYILKYYECTVEDLTIFFEPMKEHNATIKMFLHAITKRLSLLTRETVVNHLCDNLLHSMMKEVKEQYIEQIMTNDIFLNLGISSTKSQKKLFLFVMLRRLLMTAVGLRAEDDRDHLRNKRFETAGYLLSELFRALYKRFLRLVEQQLQKKQDLLVAISRINIISQGIKSCFSTGNWGIPKSNYIRCGVSQILSRLSYNATLSHLRRILIPIGKEGKNSKIRQIHCSQFGYICANECFDPMTLIRTWNGYDKYAKDIVKGDVLINEEWRPTVVQETVGGETFMYDILPLDTSFMGHTVTWNHVLTLALQDGQDRFSIVDIRLGDYLKLNSEMRCRCFLFKKEGNHNGIGNISLFQVMERGVGVFVGWRLDGTGRFCLADGTVTHNTPEGGSAGIVKSFSLFAKVSNKVDACWIRNLLEDHFQDVYHTSCPLTICETDHHVFLNGIWIGLSDKPCEFVYKFKEFRRFRLIPSTVSISVFSKEAVINIYSDDGRILRPLWNLKEFTKAEIEGHLSKKRSWESLCSDGLIEYVDAHELENAYVSMYFDESKPEHTYCEIHPSFIFGVCVNLIPYVDHIQAPRITYQSAMSKQAIGIFSGNSQYRSDSVSHVLCYPEKPVVQTHMSELLKYDELASGNNVIVAIACYGGFNQEDSLIINKGSLDRGLFRSFTYKTIMIEERKRGSYSSEVIELPEEAIRNKLFNYDKLNTKGIIKVGSYVGTNDVVVGKTVQNSKKTSTYSKMDSSVVIKNGEEGYIDSVFESVTPDGYLMIKIKLRTQKIPEMGDKFACYHPDTDILTSSGWKCVADVSVRDEVACLIDGCRLQYFSPVETQTYDFDGGMYSVENKDVDLIVTPNHRMYSADPVHHTYKVTRADDIFGETRCYKKNVEIWEPVGGGCESTFILDGVGDLPPLHLDLEWWCIFMGVWYSEGCGAVLKRRENALPFQMDVVDVEKGEWTIRDPRLIKYLESLPKGIPEWCFRLDQYHTRKLLDGLGDRISTPSIQFRDDVQRLCLHAGYSCDYEKDSVLVVCKRVTNAVVNNNGSQNDRWVNYTGPVYCCTVPTEDGVIFVRRNGKPVWCANSRSAQKGIVGLIMNQEDMPFTSEGIVPDIIINPHSQPSRMTINQLMECVAAKSAVIRGDYVYSTPFSTYSHDIVPRLTSDLRDCGYQRNGNEMMMNGLTGKPFKTEIFIGPTYYQRLKHLVSNKIHARDHGSVQTLVRQPLEGRSKDGGLRFGEMERDCLMDTPIPHKCGLSFMLSRLGGCGNQVIGWVKDNVVEGLVFAEQTHFMDKGVRECLELIFEDGRAIKCTADHRLLDSNGEWIHAKDVIPTETRLKAGVTFPLVDLEEEVVSCRGWSVDVGGFKFDTCNTTELLKTFAFARIIGLLITDGHIESEYENARVYLEHEVDVQAFDADFRLAFDGIKPGISKMVNYTARFPLSVTRALLTLHLVRGNKTHQDTRLPSFVTSPECPVPVVREFLGGLFGGDGHTCILGMHRGKRDILTSISFSKSSLEPYLSSVHTVLQDIIELLNRCGIHKITVQKPKEITCSKKRGTDCTKTFSGIIHLDIEELLNFHETIGFRYCIHKSLRLEAAVSYKRFKNNVIRQHNWLINKVDEVTQFSVIKTANPSARVTTSKALDKAIKELKETEPLYHEYAIPTTHDFTDHLIKKTQKSKFRSSSFPTAAMYMESINTYEWFIYKNPDGTHQKMDNKVCFGIKQYDHHIPTMNLKVISVRSIGPQRVYDIQVDKTESFLANGVVAHNCMISHGVSKFLNERLFDLSDKFQVPVCRKCGFLVHRPNECNLCDHAEEDSVCMVPLPYACKLLFQELIAMGMKVCMNVEKN